MVVAVVGAFYGAHSIAGVVAGDNEQCVGKPRLVFCPFEETLQSHVDVTDAFEVWMPTFFGINVGITSWNMERMVRRSTEQRRDKWLLEVAHLLGEVLEEFLVPYSPRAVEVVHAVVFCRFAVFVEAKIVIEARRTGKGFESH